MSQVAPLLNNRYRLLAVVASGGMATVYKAQDTLLSRIVAVKTLRDRYAQDPIFVQRFREEAQAAANLNHPNIVTIYDVGKDMINGVPRHYIVMEYVEGHDLKQAIRERSLSASPFGIAEAVDIARQVAEGVGFAHRRGLVHCDLKPQNVILTPEGRAKVTDFGIARAYTSMVAEKAETVWGSPQYYAPEQATGNPPTPASDVYSIGVVLYEMLAGRLPFEGKDARELARQHLNVEPAELTSLNPSVPLQLEAIVRRVLSKDPANRYRDADQLARVLAAYLQQGEEYTISHPVATAGTSSTRSGSAGAAGQGSGPSQAARPAPMQPQAGASRPVAAQTGQSMGMSASAPAATGPQRGMTGSSGAYTAADGAEQGRGSNDILLWLLGLVVIVCLAGLIVLYAFVYQAYTDPNRGLAPTPSAPAATSNAPPRVTLSAPGVITLTSLISLPLDIAQAQLGQLGLQSRVEERPDGSVTQPIVLAQSPPAGTRLQQNSVVTLIVAKPVPQAEVPQGLVGRKFDDSISQTLRAVGWTIVLSETGDYKPEKEILDSDPRAGAKLSVSGTLTLTLSTGGRFDLNVLMPPVVLENVRLTRDSYEPGQRVRFDVKWRATGTVNRGYRVAWFLIHSSGGVVRQGEDREPRNNGTPVPTVTWRAGTIVNDSYELAIPVEALSGRYRIGILMYDGNTRLRVTNPGKASTDGNDMVFLREIDVR
ncbi:MAG TPA: protein kinase [Thermoflexales bacterium]|nr:protein kinase [Thermoflexales bacterium]